jgi:purine-binding chemotaxis protein CheW
MGRVLGYIMATPNLLPNNTRSAEQYLTFTLANEVYGVEILRVQEIRGWTGVRALPNMPGFVKGVLNLRGALVPIVDLRARFGISEISYTVTTVVIVVSVYYHESAYPVGMVVDTVADVVTLAEHRVQNAPHISARVDTRFMAGMAMVGEQMVVFLDVDRVLGVNEMDALGNFVEGMKP